jgi:deazaflavin-dependent oxidoreductase (nitroreductase family)
MAKTYKKGLQARLVNGVMRFALERGKGPPFIYLVEVPGRKTGQMRSTPLDVLDVGGHRWLVAPYGVTDWVRNVRAAGEVTLRRGARSETYRATEVAPTEAVPVLRQYMKDIRIARPYFDATPDSTDEQIAADAPNHPVFRLDPVVPPAQAAP